MYSYKGKLALVTGASTGIGYAIAKELARRGANLILSATPRSEDKLHKLSSEIKDLVGRSIALVEDEGVKINYSCPDVSQADEAFRPLRAAQFAGMWSHVLTAKRDLLKPEVVWNIEQGLKLSSSDISL